MTTNEHRIGAEEAFSEVLAALAALEVDAPLEERDCLEEIETLPIADVEKRLLAVGLSPTLPEALKSVIRASTSPAVEVLRFLEEDAEDVSSIEHRPLAEVTGRLQELGMNYRAGTKEIMDLVWRHVHSRRKLEIVDKAVNDNEPTVRDWRARGSLAAIMVFGLIAVAAHSLRETTTVKHVAPTVAAVETGSMQDAGKQVYDRLDKEQERSEAASQPLPATTEKQQRVVAMFVTGSRESVAESAGTTPPEPVKPETARAPAQQSAAAPAVAGPSVSLAQSDPTPPELINPNAPIQPKPVRTIRIKPGQVRTASNGPLYTEATESTTTTATSFTAGPPKFFLPVHGHMVTSDATRLGRGIDVEVPAGTPVKAAGDGVVTDVQELDHRNSIEISHANGFLTFYAGISTPTIRVGDTVKRGDVIGRAGQTSIAGLPRVRFEMRRGETHINSTANFEEEIARPVKDR
jgi:murein DD-endopeptidase MepM/ murein hydrolase activator NlpD